MLDPVILEVLSDHVTVEHVNCLIDGDEPPQRPAFWRASHTEQLQIVECEQVVCYAYLVGDLLVCRDLPAGRRPDADRERRQIPLHGL